MTCDLEWRATRERARGLRSVATRAEQQFWALVRDRRLDGLKFRRQHPIGSFVADCYCADRHLVIEIDGSIHAEQAEYDALRDHLMRTQGLRVLRVTNEELGRDPAGVIERVRHAVRA